MPLDGFVAKESELSVTRGGMLRMDVGEAKFWPGVTIPAPKDGWDVSGRGRLEVRLRNPGLEPIHVSMRVDTRTNGGEVTWMTRTRKLDGGETGTLSLNLSRREESTLGGRLFGMRGYPAVAEEDQKADPSRVSQLLVFLPKGASRQSFEMGEIVATGAFVPPTASVGDADPYFPFVDTFGQYRHRDWPGKVGSVEEMKEHGRAEEFVMKPGEEFPGPWSQFGGWARGPIMKATGAFRPEKHAGKWWLVDPEGCLFFSHGVDCVGADDVTVIEGRETWFEGFPGDDPAFAEFRGQRPVLKGDFAGKQVPTFSFHRTNLKRKYGDDWKARSADMVHQRMRYWRLNTIGNWSSRDVYSLNRTPFTDTLGTSAARSIEGSQGYWRQFPDPFDPGFVGTLRKQMAWRKKTTAVNPWCIGYFVDNELSWGEPRKLALSTLASPADQAAKRAFIGDLRKTYGSIGKLNAVWGTKHASWKALGAHREGPDEARAGSDLDAFAERLAETYFRNIRDVIKETAPDRLYLGCRFSEVNPLAARVAAQFCDVVSFNRYRRDLKGLDFAVGDKPVIIGEFHFGALDRGMLHTGLVPVASQAERAKAYQTYVRSALKHPNVVGTHWFKWSDEPLTGRALDEENYQIGFVDVTDTLYPETVTAVQEMGRTMYRVRMGGIPDVKKDSFEGRWNLGLSLLEDAGVKNRMPSRIQIERRGAHELLLSGLPQGSVTFARAQAERLQGTIGDEERYKIDDHWEIGLDPERESPLKLYFQGEKWVEGHYHRPPLE